MSSPEATRTALFATAESRISCYQLTKKSPVDDARIHEIVNFSVKHAPSSFNVQSARVVILLKHEHDALWEVADQTIQTSLPENSRGFVTKMVQGFKAGYGTILFLEDQDALDGLAKKNPLFGHLVPEWSGVSSGMHQYLVWMALQLEGLGCNLQHFNFMPEFSKAVTAKWNLPEQWELKSQLVFGAPEGELVRKKDRAYAPLEDRVKVFGS